MCKEKADNSETNDFMGEQRGELVHASASGPLKLYFHKNGAVQVIL